MVQTIPGLGLGLGPILEATERSTAPVMQGGTR